MVEDLMKPRYKLIATYPSMRDFVLNQIVVLDKEFSPQYMMYEVEDCSGKRSYITKFFDEYPHLFKKLKWWEDRKHSELPLYVKKKDSGVLFKVEGWRTSPNTAQITAAYIDSPTDYREALFIEDIIPASQDDYNEYYQKTI